MAVSLAVAGALGQAAAQQVPAPVVIAVLDMQEVMRNAKAAQQVNVEVEKLRAAYQAEIAEQEESLRMADQELAAQRATLPPDEFQKQRQELEQRALTLRRNVQTRRDELERMFNGRMDRIRGALLEITAEIARERGATIVLSKSQVLLSEKGMDITLEALSKLDERLPSVEMGAP